MNNFLNRFIYIRILLIVQLVSLNQSNILYLEFTLILKYYALQ